MKDYLEPNPFPIIGLVIMALGIFLEIAYQLNYINQDSLYLLIPIGFLILLIGSSFTRETSSD